MVLGRGVGPLHFTVALCLEPTYGSGSSGEGGIHCGNHDQGPAVTFSGHVRSKIGGGEVLRIGLARAPFHKQTIGQTAEQTQEDHTIRMAHATSIIIMRNVQTLVQTVFYSCEAGAIDLQPSRGVESLGRSAGQQRDGFGFAARGLTMHSGDLGCCREANCFRGGGSRTEKASFIPAAIALLGAGTRAGRVLRGERLPEYPAVAFLSFCEFRADCL